MFCFGCFPFWFRLVLKAEFGSWLVLVFSHEPSSLFHHSVLVDLSVSTLYDDALTELVNHYANRTLIVSCTKGYT